MQKHRTTSLINGCLIITLTLLSAFSLATEKPQPAMDHEALLTSSDPVLEANKRLVYNMYREVLQGGHAELAEKYIAKDYIQHNPNVASGRDALVAFIKGSRPAVEIKDKITLPVIAMAAEKDLVMISFIRPEKDADGNPYYTTWFDLFRIENGKIAEHWDPALKSADALKMNPNKKTLD